MAEHLTPDGKFKSDLTIDGVPFDWPAGYVPVKIGGRDDDLLRELAIRCIPDDFCFAGDLIAALDVARRRKAEVRDARIKSEQESGFIPPPAREPGA